jgi:hypothetical protein
MDGKVESGTLPHRDRGTRQTVVHHREDVPRVAPVAVEEGVNAIEADVRWGPPNGVGGKPAQDAEMLVAGADTKR